MKTIHIPLEDMEYNKLNKKRGDLTWKEFIMQIEINSQNKEKRK